MKWICPICHEPLAGGDALLACANGHSFDRAREGHVNFLVGQQSAKAKGDTRAMLGARVRFQEAGYYEPLRDQLIELVGELRSQTVVEIGCGVGYYLGGVAESQPDFTCIGTDIAKDAVRIAAKRYPRVSFAVADTKALIPLANGSTDALLNIFAPRNAAEFARILRPAGRLIVVIPTDRHLAELRQSYNLLAIQTDKHQAVIDSLAAQFKLVSEELVTIQLNLNPVAITDLLDMTPNAWFMNRTHQPAAKPTYNEAVTAEFELLSFALK